MRRAAALLLAAALAAAMPAGAQDGGRLYTVEEAQLLGMAAIGSGRPDIAATIAQGLLAADPDDPYAHFLLARAYLDAGALAQAQAAGKRAFRLARSPEQRFQAARLTAQAAWNRDHFPAAQWWLRRAAAAAPSDAQREATLRELRSVRGRNPLSFGIAVSVTPSDNVNNGASSQFNIIDGVPVVGWLSPDGQALAGVVAEVQADAGWRLRQDATSITTLGASVDLREVRLSGAARAAAPDLDPDAYDSARAELVLRHVWRPQGRPWEIAGHAALGVLTEAGSLDFRYARLGADYLRGFGDRTGLRLGAAHEWRDARPGDPQGDSATSLQASVTRLLPGDDRLTAAVYASAFRTDRDGRSSTTHGARLSWQDGQPLGPVQIGASIGFGQTHFPGYSVGVIPVPGGRLDQTFSASLDMTFPDLSWAGFAPRVTLSHVTTDSNVSRFETRRTGLLFGIESRF